MKLLGNALPTDMQFVGAVGNRNITPDNVDKLKKVIDKMDITKHVLVSGGAKG